MNEQLKPKMRKTTMKKRFFQAMNRTKKGQHFEMYKWFFHENGRFFGKCFGLYLSKGLWGWDVYYDLGSARFEFRNQELKEVPNNAL